MNLTGVLCFAFGGALLVLSLYLACYGALSSYRIYMSGTGPLINGLILGFAALLLIGIGLSLILESSRR